MVLDQLLVLWPAFVIGILHTLMPCEDKAIFCFWSFGISKDWKNSMTILMRYGAGLMTANVSIGAVTSLFSLIFTFIPIENYVFNFFGALVSIIVAIYMLFYIFTRQYTPHSKHTDELKLDIDWQSKRTPYILGILAGAPPCIFEILIYTQCFTWTLSYGILSGLLTIISFSIGTFLGLFPLAMLSQYGSRIRKSSQKKSSILSLIMIILIIFFNTIILFLSLFRIEIFPYEPEV